MKLRHNIACLTTILMVFSACRSTREARAKDWQSIFNGKDLSGWDIKITKHPLNENYRNTFRVEDNTLRVSYDDYQKFDGQFGHLYYQTPLSYYKLSFDYRFTGNHVPDAPGYADRNSGIMVHSQSAESVELNQTFPVSLEMQLMAGNGTNPQPTGNLCTPGTEVYINNKPVAAHCINAVSKTYNKDVWVHAEIEVYGDSLLRHIVEGDTVLTYTRPTIGGGFVGGDYNWKMASINDSLTWVNKAGSRLTEGYIALQAESQPIDFKNISLLNLAGCKDPEAKNYKEYYIKADNSKCRY